MKTNITDVINIKIQNTIAYELERKHRDFEQAMTDASVKIFGFAVWDLPTEQLQQAISVRYTDARTEELAKDLVQIVLNADRIAILK